MTAAPPRHMTMNTGTATGARDGADEPCPAIGANLIALMTDEARTRLEARFWAKTEEDPETGCVEWAGSPSTGGYGMFWIARGVTSETHRAAYVLERGPIPAGLLVLHSCHNRLCVNPDHLRLGTHEDNMQEMAEAGRARQGRGSNPRKLTAETATMILGDQLLGVSIKETARDMGVAQRMIGAVRAGRRWAAAMSAHIDAFLAAEAAERDRKPPAR